MELTRVLSAASGKNFIALKKFSTSILSHRDQTEISLIGLMSKKAMGALEIEKISRWSVNKINRWLSSGFRIGAFNRIPNPVPSIYERYLYGSNEVLMKEIDLLLAEGLGGDQTKNLEMREWLGWCPAFEAMKDLWGKASDEEKQFFCERYMDAVKAIVEEASKDERIFDLFAGFLDGNILTRYAANDRFGIVYQGDARKVFLALKHFLREGIVERKPSGYRLVRHKRLAGPYALKFTGGKPLEKWGRMVAIVE